jgi:hypothetical protein
MQLDVLSTVLEGYGLDVETWPPVALILMLGSLSLLLQVERGLERQERALQSPQPLWALWDGLNEQMDDVRTMEFFALAHHRPAVRDAVVEYSARYREMQLDVLSTVLAGYGLDVDTWPPVVLILTLGSLSMLLSVEHGMGFEVGHAEVVAAVERQITELEGDRWTGHPALAHRGSEAGRLS